MKLARKHLLGMEGVSRTEIETLLNSAETFKEILDRKIPKVPSLRGLTAVNLFFEPSTRTRLSFELAEKRLSADSVSISPSGSSSEKGESLIDTIHNVEAMKVDFLIVRHSAAGAPHFLASRCDVAVINAGDGCHEHPTQALLDLFTIRQHLPTFEGLKVAILGDIAHSRVARSNIWALRTMGADVTLCAPRTLLPPGIEDLGAKIHPRLDDLIDEMDIIMVLRIQKERQGESFLPSSREYARHFSLTRSRADRMKANSFIMHPGPINRGIEMAPEVADGPRSVILDQVTNGVAVRMAVLYLLAGGETDHALAN